MRAQKVPASDWNATQRSPMDAFPSSLLLITLTLTLPYHRQEATMAQQKAQRAARRARAAQAQVRESFEDCTKDLASAPSCLHPCLAFC